MCGCPKNRYYTNSRVHCYGYIIIRTETVEGDGKKESPVHSVERYRTLEGELLVEKVYMGKQQEGESNEERY